jgi:hypothetical protein
VCEVNGEVHEIAKPKSLLVVRSKNTCSKDLLIRGKVFWKEPKVEVSILVNLEVVKGMAHGHNQCSCKRKSLSWG